MSIIGVPSLWLCQVHCPPRQSFTEHDSFVSECGKGPAAQARARVKC